MYMCMYTDEHRKNVFGVNNIFFREKSFLCVKFAEVVNKERFPEMLIPHYMPAH